MKKTEGESWRNEVTCRVVLTAVIFVHTCSVVKSRCTSSHTPPPSSTCRLSRHAHRQERWRDHGCRGGVQTAGRETTSGPNTEGAGGETTAGGGEVRVCAWVGGHQFWLLIGCFNLLDLLDFFVWVFDCLKTSLWIWEIMLGIFHYIVPFYRTIRQFIKKIFGWLIGNKKIVSYSLNVHVYMCFYLWMSTFAERLMQNLICVQKLKLSMG